MPQPPAGGGRALFRLVRFWSRRWSAAAAGVVFEDQRRVNWLLVLEAVSTAAGRGPVSVADVADELGLDRSGASRMVADAVDAGLVLRAVADDDGRRAVLTLSDQGAGLLAAAHHWQEQVFADLVADWEPEDRVRLDRYLQRLAEQPAPSPPTPSLPKRGARR